MKKVFFRRALQGAFILLFTQSFVSAQEKPVIESPDIITKEKQYPFFGEDQSGLYGARMSGFGGTHQLFIDKYDKTTLKNIFSRELTNYALLQDKTRRASFVLNCFVVKEKVYCFYQYFDNKKDTMHVILQTMSANGDVADAYSVLQVPTRNAFLSCLVKFSPDKESFFVSADPASYSINMWDPTAKVGIELFSRMYKTATLEKIWQKNISDYEKSYNVSDMVIDNKYNLYFLINKNETSVLAMLSPTSPTLKDLPELISKDLKVESATLNVNTEGDVLFSGIYADKTKDGRGFFGDPGLFIRVINPSTMELKLSKDHPFKSEVMEKLSMGRMTKKPNADQKKLKQEPGNLFAAPIFKESSDAYYFVTEDVFSDLWAGKKQFKDIIVIKTLKNGDLKSETVIPRYNVSGYKSVTTTAFMSENRLYVMFGESPELAGKKLDEYESLTMPQLEDNAGNIVIVNATEGGSFSKKVYFLNKEKPSYNNPYSPIPIVFDSNKLIFTKEDTKANLVKYVVYKLY